MTRIIVVGSAKGGSGRTTLAANLAAQSAAAGLSVLLVDGTGNAPCNARQWMALRRTMCPAAAAISLISLEGPSFSAELLQSSKGYDVAIVDTSRGENRASQDALAIADAVVVPMQQDPLQVELHQQYGYFLCHARAMNPKLRIIMVDNQVPLRRRRADVIAQWEGFFSEHLPGLRQTPLVPIYNHPDYSEAAGRGLGVVEQAGPESEAAQESMALWSMVMNRTQPEV